MSVCIYCMEDKELMNRDHVIPECYGAFSNNLVLHDTVCRECNQYFGDNVELYLGRDTIEGIERYKHGLRAKGKVKRERIKFNIAQGPLKGMIAEPIPSQRVAGEVDVDPVMQVGFFNNISQGFDYFEMGDVPSVEDLERRGYEIRNRDKPIQMIAKDDEGIKHIRDVLASRGMNVAIAGEADWPDEVRMGAKTVVSGEIRVDSLIFRGMAKIGFNYLTYTAGKSFALNDSFNSLRAFIRYGTGRSLDFCDVSRRPILQEERRYGARFTRGHLVIVEWQGPLVISKVSTFNLNTYFICLCRYFRGIIRDITSGHHFDVESRNVTRLIHANRRFTI